MTYINIGKVSAKDKNGNTFQVPIDDPRLKNGDLVGVNKGKVTVKDKFGNTFQTNQDDIRFETGEISHVSCGLMHITNGFETKAIDKNLAIPDGWWKGEHYIRIGKRGSENTKAKKCCIDGIIYGCIKDAETSLNRSRKFITKRLKSEKFPDWKYI